MDSHICDVDQHGQVAKPVLRVSMKSHDESPAWIRDLNNEYGDEAMGRLETLADKLVLYARLCVERKAERLRKEELKKNEAPTRLI